MEQRCIAAQFYVSCHDLPQHRHLLVLNSRAQQPHRCGQCRTAQPQPQCQPQGLPVQRQHLHHKFPVQLLHRLSRNFGKTKSRGLLPSSRQEWLLSTHFALCAGALQHTKSAWPSWMSGSSVCNNKRKRYGPLRGSLSLCYPPFRFHLLWYVSTIIHSRRSFVKGVA